jgi:abortive infection bacteriophage resistance protein
MPLIPYTKPALTFPDQLQQLKDRGLIIENDTRAIHLLEKISYYRLSGYWYPLLELPKDLHVFKPNSTFDKSFDIYCFDRELRILISGELEKIEVAIRAKMIYILSHVHGSFWFTNPALFTDRSKLNVTIRNLEKEYNRSEEEFITAFKIKYSESLPPCWMMFEISSFGNLSSLYKNLKPTIYEKRVIAK